MKYIKLLLTLSSLNVLLVTVERFSFTTRILLQPYNFLRLHEVLQITTLILLSVMIPFFLLREVTNKFEDLKSTRGMLLGVVFITGIYFYATGNGIHELASFFFNSYCPTDRLSSVQCNGMFINDYYFGNILYFVGAIFMNAPLLLFERNRPQKTMSKNDMFILSINALVYAFAIFAYAAFDRVTVGIIYSIIFTIITCYLFLTKKHSYKRLPLTTYCLLSYITGTIAAVFVRFII